jgi:hypothetical protein
MGELKSAWEIAQERANRLGKLSAEEEEQQARQRCDQTGQVLAQKWLDASQQLDISAELKKHKEEERNIIKQAIIEHLAEAIGFTATQDIRGMKKAVEGIGSLGPQLQPKAEEISKLVQEYEGAEQKIRQELESDYRETLHKLRISGTAVDAINIEVTPEWLLARQELVEAFTPRLSDLRQGLINSS